MGKVFRFVRYRTRTDRSGAIDFDEVGAIAREHRPKLVLCGHSSYPRELDYAAFKRVADDVGALTMADISHVGGLVAGGVSGNPLDVGFDIVTTTTHKSLRGPRGGLILCRSGLARSVDSSVFPGLQGGPHMNAVAGAAITFGKALQPDFRQYAQRVCDNARVLASGLLNRGATLVTGGTDNHLMVVDAIASFGVDGHEAERALDRVGITTNKQIIPDDTRPPLRPSGVRLGTPACTTRGMGPDDMEFLAGAIVESIVHRHDERRMRELQTQVRDFCARFPVPGMESNQ
jgi:glycine hydroxymethyltransferase